MTVRKVRIGTRGSRLALEQTKIVMAMLSEKASGLDAQVVPIKTLGDRPPAEARGETDGKGAFTGDIEALLIEGNLDMAVHSLKDLSVKLDHRLRIGATPPRGDPRDALISAQGDRLADLPRSASVGTIPSDQNTSTTHERDHNPTNPISGLVLPSMLKNIRQPG